MSEIITYKFDSERWTRLFSKMKENDRVADVLADILIKSTQSA